MKRKTIFSLMLATVMMLGSTLNVFAANTTDITEESTDKTAQIEVVVEIDSQFIVGIPVSAVIDKETSQGTYTKSVLGDLDPRYKLVVTPQDGYLDTDGDTTSDTNFLLEDQSNPLAPKDPLVVKVTDSTTEFITTDINMDTPVEVTCTMEITDGELSAGNWHGVIKYLISLELINEGP